MTIERKIHSTCLGYTGDNSGGQNQLFVHLYSQTYNNNYNLKLQEFKKILEDGNYLLKMIPDELTKV